MLFESCCLAHDTPPHRCYQHHTPDRLAHLPATGITAYLGCQADSWSDRPEELLF
jgi:hypothetical protein